MKTCLIFDVHYLCYRAFYSRPRELKFGDARTGMFLGFFHDVLHLQELFSPDVSVFCFDSASYLRRELLPSYKRRDKTEEERNVRKQIVSLREEILPKLGYRNIRIQKGYEADDLIATTASKPKYNHVVVTSDKDLMQVLNRSTILHNPRSGKTTTVESFEKQFGVDPTCWPHVLAMAGDPVDNVAGIPNVGIKTAIKFLTGDLQTGKKYDSIVMHNKLWRSNLPIVTLPYPGTRKWTPKADIAKKSKWLSVLRTLGLQSLVREFL